MPGSPGTAMNENAISAESGGADAGARIGPEGSLPRPCGFWSTAAWTLAAFALAAVAVGGWVFWLNWDELETTPDPQEDAWFTLQLILLNVVQVAVLALAARQAGWPVSLYLGLVPPRARDLLHGIVATGMLLGALEILTHLLGRESVSPFQTDSYRTSQAAGLLP